MAGEDAKVTGTYKIKIEKFDGDITPDKEPVEVVEKEGSLTEDELETVKKGIPTWE